MPSLVYCVPLQCAHLCNVSVIELPPLPPPVSCIALVCAAVGMMMLVMFSLYAVGLYFGSTLSAYPRACAAVIRRVHDVAATLNSNPTTHPLHFCVCSSVRRCSH